MLDLDHDAGLHLYSGNLYGGIETMLVLLARLVSDPATAIAQ
jgi:hypothetical protein